MDAILYRNVQIGTSLPEGYHIWNRYHIKNNYLYTEKFVSNYTSGRLFFDDRKMSMMAMSYTFDTSTGIYTLVNPSSQLTSVIGNNKRYAIGSSLPSQSTSGSTLLCGISTTQDLSSPNGSNHNYTVTCGKYSSDRTLLSQTRGELFDTIVSNDSFQDNAVNGSYWYELVQ